MKLPQLNYFSPSSDNQLAPRIFQTKLPGLLYLAHQQYEDNRGFYAEIALLPDLQEIIDQPFQIAQINEASSHQHVTRGLHAENWNKLVTITSGTAYCVLVDLRFDLPSFGQAEYILLGKTSPANNGSLYIPAGIANSYCVLQAPLDYVYCVDQLYANRDHSGDVAISIFDPDLNLIWPIDAKQMVRSNRDINAIALKDKFPSHV